MKNEAHAFAFWLRSGTFAAFCATYMSLTSCGGPAVVTRGSPTVQPAPHTTPGARAESIRVGYKQNGRTLTLHPGEILIVALPLTTWSFQGSSNPRALIQVGSALVSPAPFNKTTCPYGGCGTVTAKFRAVGPGTSRVSASRESCGEAMGCTGAAARYRLSVVVTAVDSAT